MKSSNLAKSLHTLTVLVNVAENYHRYRTVVPPTEAPDVSARRAVAAALDILKLADKPDAYGLAENAIGQLTKVLST